MLDMSRRPRSQQGSGKAQEPNDEPARKPVVRPSRRTRRAQRSDPISSGRLSTIRSKSGRVRSIPAVKGVSSGRLAAVPRRRRERTADTTRTRFQPGISLSVKIAAFTAVLVVVLMSLLGHFLYRVAVDETDRQINDKGVIAARELAAFVDPIFFGNPFGQQGASDYRRIKEQRRTASNKNLQKLVTDTRHNFLHIRVTKDVEGAEFPILSASVEGEHGNDPEVALALIRSQGEVSISEGTYKSSKFHGRVRRFVVPVYIDGTTTEDSLAPTGDEIKEKPTPVAYVHVFVKAAAIDEVKSLILNKVLLATCIGIVVAIFVSIASSLYLVRPLRDVVQDMHIVAEGNLNHQAAVITGDEIGLVAQQFNEMTHSLREARKREQARQAIENELAIATEIQTKLLPDRLPQIPGIDLFSYYESAKEVGGDYYDFLVIDKTHLGIIVADVSGKGIPGAMVMTMVRSLLRLASHREISPAETLKKVNRILARDIRSGMFVTALYGVLDVQTRKLTVSSAGHNPMIYCRAADNTCHKVNPSGMALGFDKGRTFDETIREQTITLSRGDTLIVYTDGVIEAMNEDNEEFTLESLIDFAARHNKISSKDLTNGIVAAIERHRMAAEQSDDITITTMRVE